MWRQLFSCIGKIKTEQMQTLNACYGCKQYYQVLVFYVTDCIFLVCEGCTDF